MKTTYKLNKDDNNKNYIECLICNTKSYDIDDISEKYCKTCKEFHSKIVLKQFLRRNR